MRQRGGFTPDDLRHVFAEGITYKPGARFEVIESDSFVARCWLTQPTVDANHPENLTSVSRQFYVPLVSFEDDPLPTVHRQLYNVARKQELHELDEFFRVDGVPFVEPHPLLPGIRTYLAQ